MKFQLGIDSIEIETPADYPYGKVREIIQVSERSAAGVVHVESYELALNRRNFSYSDLSAIEYEKLVNWFNDVSKGKQYKFTVTDDLGETFEARFNESELDFQLTGYNLWTGSFTLEEEV